MLLDIAVAVVFVLLLTYCVAFLSLWDDRQAHGVVWSDLTQQERNLTILAPPVLAVKMFFARCRREADHTDLKVGVSSMFNRS